MDESSIIIFILIIVVLLVVCVWLIAKLNGQEAKRDILAKENSRLIADNALLEAEHLKFQLQPHTLNNILAKMKVIANKLNKGMESLSETLDYILYKGNNHLVSVEDEINFIQKYLALNDLFISEIDAIKFDDSLLNKNSKYYTTQCIPHLISAYFIENAFKHGDINQPDFLKIQLKLSDTLFELNVVNRIRQKPKTTKVGIGLNNMKKRLELLLSGKYEIVNSCNEQYYYTTLIIRF